jgi:hypothetical protein
MGVPESLLGRQVRCPNCKQVVLAPATPPAAAPPDTAPTPPAPAPGLKPTPTAAPGIQIVSPAAPATKPGVAAPPPPPPEPDLPVLNVPQRSEDADSILSEGNDSDDEVFGSHPSRRLQSLPPLDQPPAPPEADVAKRQPGPPPGPTAPALPGELPDLFPGLEPIGPAATAPSSPVQQVPADSPGANPFADFEGAATAATGARPVVTADDEPPAPARPKKKRERVEEAEPSEEERKPASAGRSRAPAKSGVSPVVLLLVAGYALVATALAAYGLFFKTSGGPDTGHPLSTIPDNFGEFDPATRKKVTQYKFPVDGELPPAQRAKLGEKIAIDDLEIQPLRVEKRRLEIRTESADGKETATAWSAGKALVLTLHIKNTSPDLSLFPMDPAFTRQATRADQPITRVVVNKSTVFAGGAIPWPFGEKVKRKLDVQQQNDYVALPPGESREYVVFTDARADIISAVEAAKSEIEWRVQVRRGPVEYRGREVPVTAVIGVEFTAADVH